jgi:hypothetical protein
MQECLTRRLRRRIVRERPCLHSREHVRRIRLILLWRRGPSSWQRWRGTTDETVSVSVGRLLPESWVESGGFCREKGRLKISNPVYGRPERTDGAVAGQTTHSGKTQGGAARVARRQTGLFQTATLRRCSL